MLAIIGALNEELSGLKKRMSVEKAVRRGGCSLRAGNYRGVPVILVQSGIGRERAERAVKVAAETYQITSLLSFGFAGALREDLDIGDIVVCSEIWYRDRPGDALLRWADSGLATRSKGQAETGVYLGTSLTVDRPVTRPEDKKALAASIGADIVDMEGYWLAKAAASRGIPFLAVRAVTDRLNDRLIPFEKALDAGSEWRWPHAIGLFARPDNLARLPTLFSSARTARRRLTEWADYLMENA